MACATGRRKAFLPGMGKRGFPVPGFFSASGAGEVQRRAGGFSPEPPAACGRKGGKRTVFFPRAEAKGRPGRAYEGGKLFPAEETPALRRPAGFFCRKAAPRAERGEEAGVRPEGRRGPAQGAFESAGKRAELRPATAARFRPGLAAGRGRERARPAYGRRKRHGESPCAAGHMRLWGKRLSAFLRRHAGAGPGCAEAFSPGAGQACSAFFLLRRPGATNIKKMAREAIWPSAPTR